MGKLLKVVMAVTVAFVVLLAAGCGAQGPKETVSANNLPEAKESKYYKPETLRVGLIPNISPEKQLAKYEPLEKYLEEKLGMPVELFVATNYTGVVQAMVAEKLDLAYFGALTYAQALQQTELEPIVTEIDKETGTTKYYSEIIARTDSGVNTLDDLKGKTFAFGDPSSTSGSLYPRMMLVEAGYDWKEKFAPLSLAIFSGGHDATAQAVLNGTVDAGGVEGRILRKLIKDGKVDGGKLKTIAKQEVEGYPWCVPSNLDPELKKKLVEIFVTIDDPELLDLLRAERYVEINADAYKEALDKGIELGLISPKV
ncbi:MAG: phosphate/phosphite/phosphonate ABC transporter substrate-binding protein [Actinobacteria bacterium]|nr:phosphate/phosphite/phosphonate ABC transporter substrate-binding protein [Actinomycetota bacterium]